MSDAAPSAELWSAFNQTGNTRALVWHGVYSEWQALADPQRVVIEDCRWIGWGETASAAIGDLLANVVAGTNPNERVKRP